MSFTKKVEDFTCDHCGTRVTGDGYTNHCPACLWSKHVDEHPGDRASLCGGAMEPQSVVVFKGTYRIFHRCTKCSFIRAQDTVPQDNMEKLIELSTQPL